MLMWAGKAPVVATISCRTAVRAVAAAEFHAQIEECVSAQAQRSCERGERGDGALTLRPGGIVKQVRDVCARRAAEGACKSCRVAARG